MRRAATIARWGLLLYALQAAAGIITGVVSALYQTGVL